MDLDRETLAAIFAARVSLLKKTPDEAAEDARSEHARAVIWMKSKSMKDGAFLWFCDEFELDPGAVRRAIAEKRK